MESVHADALTSTQRWRKGRQGRSLFGSSANAISRLADGRSGVSAVHAPGAILTLDTRFFDDGARVV